MGYIMFIRHGEKAYKNNKGKPKHDPGLIKTFSDRNIIKIIKQFQIYGFPDEIISSPFLRTRETSKKIKKFLPLNTEIIIDKDVEEYLGFQKPIGEIADLNDETKKYTNPKIGVEKFDNIQKRIVKFYNKIKDKDKNILVITHGILISRLASYFDLHIKYINELEGIIIINNNIKKLN